MISSPRILIVDDEIHICNSLKILLSRQGYRIYTATSGRQAIDLMENNPIDLVLLDMVIPDMNGFQIMDHINAKSYDSLIIVITGNASIESAVEALKKGAFDYLKKPFEHEELLKRVGNALNQKRLLHEKEVIKGKLKQAEEKYQSLVQNSPDLIYILDEKNNFSFANVTFEKLLGFTPEQLRGKPFKSIVHNCDLKKAKTMLFPDMSGQISPPDMELWLKDSDNSSKARLFEVKHALIESETLNRDKPEIVIHGTARDITYHKELENQLIHARKMEAVGTLTSGLAHDYNNILTNILGYTSLIQMQVSPEAPFYSKLEGIEQCVDRGAKLTLQLLDFASKRPGDVIPVNINSLIQKTAHMFGCINKGLALEVDFRPDIWTVEVNKSQIEQLLLNMFINAGHAMPQGGTIFLRTENVELDDNYKIIPVSEPGKYVKITIRDTGSGMTEEIRQRIFEPFFTTKEAGKGTGLGLAMAYSTLKNHRGGITVESKIGEGTVFTIFIPSLKETAEKSRKDKALIKRSSDTILLVDDEEEIAVFGKEILESLGFNVLTARDGQDGLGLYLENRDSIALAIIDLIMPKMRGGELFDRLREIDPHLKVLLASGYSLNDEAQNILHRGCDGFIQKPFGAEMLFQKILEIM